MARWREAMARGDTRESWTEREEMKTMRDEQVLPRSSLDRKKKKKSCLQGVSSISIDDICSEKGESVTQELHKKLADRDLFPPDDYDILLRFIITNNGSGHRVAGLRAGVAQYMKTEWRVVAIFDVVLFVILSIIYFVGC